MNANSIDCFVCLIIDIDECSSSSHGCDVNAVCSNVQGSYHCACKAGYSGDGKSCTGEWIKKKKQENLRTPVSRKTIKKTHLLSLSESSLLMLAIFSKKFQHCVFEFTKDRNKCLKAIRLFNFFLQISGAFDFHRGNSGPFAWTDRL